MARPRTITDQRLLDAAGLVIGRVGPGFTLAMVAREAGVSVGTVAGRFGAKAGLLRALTERGVEQAGPVIRAAWDAAADPVAGLRAAAIALHARLGGPDEAANHLGQLGVDLQDQVLRELLGRYYAAMAGEIAACCAAARAALPGMPAPPVAARVLLGLVNGAALDWSIRPLGALADRLGEDVDAVLDGWRRGEESG
ncbi:TetR/AcrR family transcriptional regulator [Actinokineospora sp. NPDC004072]